MNTMRAFVCVHYVRNVCRQMSLEMCVCIYIYIRLWGHGNVGQSSLSDSHPINIPRQASKPEGHEGAATGFHSPIFSTDFGDFPAICR